MLCRMPSKIYNPASGHPYLALMTIMTERMEIPMALLVETKSLLEVEAKAPSMSTSLDSTVEK